MEKAWVVTLVICATMTICGLFCAQDPVWATSGCEWDGIAEAFATSSECGSWLFPDVVWSEGCSENCSVYASGEFQSDWEERYWYVCRDGDQIDSGTGNYVLDEFIVLDCGENFSFVFNHGCDAHPGAPCDPGPGVLEFMMQAKCEEC